MDDDVATVHRHEAYFIAPDVEGTGSFAGQDSRSTAAAEGVGAAAAGAYDSINLKHFATFYNNLG